MGSFLVVGGGSIGQRHARNLLAKGASVAFVEPDASRRGKLAAEFNTTAFPTLSRALKHGYSGALVCNPTSFHLKPAKQCIEAGLPLFIEKPLSSSLKDVDALVRLADERKVPVLVGCNLRFTQSLSKVKQLLDSGAIGKILSARIEFGYYLPDWRPGVDYRNTYSARKAEGGGVVLDAIHELDYARWLLGREPVSVGATARRLGALGIDVEDSAEITLDFGSVLAQVHLDYLQRQYRRNAQFIGTNGTLFWDYPSHAVRWSSEGSWKEEQFQEQPNDMYARELEHFLRCVDGSEKPAQDLRAAASALKTALSALKSSEKGKTVFL